MNAKTISSLLVAAIVCFPAFVVAQVKIPAKSGSTLDSPDEAAPLTSSAVSNRSPFSNRSNISRNAPSGPNELQPPAPPLPKPGAVTAIQRVEDPKQNIDPKRSMRLAELRRELGISQTVRQARISLPTEDLFEETAPTTIDNLAEATLKKVAEYLDLSGFTSVTVKPFFLRDKPNDKALSWTRTLSLIEWMNAHTKLGDEAFHAGNPDPVLKPTPKKVSKNLGESEFVGRIELRLE